MPAATAFDVVDVCITWAKARTTSSGSTLWRAEPAEGSRTIFSEEECKNKFAAGHGYEGVAINLFSLDFKRWAVENQKVSLIEAKVGGRSAGTSSLFPLHR